MGKEDLSLSTKNFQQPFYHSAEDGELGWLASEIWYEDDSLGQWLSKDGPKTSSISLTWELVRNANSQAHPSLTESEILRVGLAIQVILIHAKV